MKKVVLIVCMFVICLINVKGLKYNYSDSINKTNDYLNSVYDDYERYLLTKGNVSYGYDKAPYRDSNFTKGGFLNLNEYKISINEETKTSYLSDLEDYWTMTSSGINVYFVENNKYDLKSKNLNSNVKITEYVQSDVIAIGEGTYENPFVFIKRNKIEVNSENEEYGIVEPNVVYTEKNATVKIVPKPNYYYDSYKCDNNEIATYNNDSKTLTFDNINEDISCEVIFKKNAYQLVINYKYWDDRPISTYSETKLVGENYNIISKNNILGYSPSPASISGNMSNEDKTYIVEYSPINYNINYELNGGNAINQNTYNIEQQININNPIKEGYNFIGWTGTGISAPTKELSIPKNSTGNKKYTANWKLALTCAELQKNYKCKNKTVGKSPYFTYDGNCSVICDGDNNENWKIEFTSSGNLIVNKNMDIDVFLVGGGGGAGTGTQTGGGGGGYTKTVKKIKIDEKTKYNIVVGAGGKSGKSGNESSAFDYKASGGYSGTNWSANLSKVTNGGNGGSGGGSYGFEDSGYEGTCYRVAYDHLHTYYNEIEYYAIPYGGQNGKNGDSVKTMATICTGGKATNNYVYSNGGKGQIEQPGPNGETGNTCEFGEGNSYGCNNGVKMYSGGGAGGRYTNENADIFSCVAGEESKNNAWFQSIVKNQKMLSCSSGKCSSGHPNTNTWNTSNVYYDSILATARCDFKNTNSDSGGGGNANNGTPNTGGGGGAICRSGAGGNNKCSNNKGGTGGSGIVIIRNTR